MWLLLGHHGNQSLDGKTSKCWHFFAQQLAIIFIGTWGLLKESFNLALDAVPRHIDPKEVKNFLSNLPGVSQIHDFHIWGMSTTEVALTAHVVKQNATDDDSLIAEIKKELYDRFGIGHTTIQWERGDELHSNNSHETSR